MIVMNYPTPFRAEEAAFLHWQEVEEPRRAELIDAFLDGPESGGFPPKALCRVKTAMLPFYQDVALAAFCWPQLEQDQFVFIVDGELCPERRLDGINEVIYALNEVAELTISPDTILDYCRFFFHFVRGHLGWFHIVEAPDQIPWQAKTEFTLRCKADTLILPLTYKGQRPDGLHRVTASVLFKNALFHTDILVAPKPLDEIFTRDDDTPENFSMGQIALVNERLLLENLPLKLEHFPGPQLVPAWHPQPEAHKGSYLLH